jgi:hypothetical protein
LGLTDAFPGADERLHFGQFGLLLLERDRGLIARERDRAQQNREPTTPSANHRDGASSKDNKPPMGHNFKTFD